MIKLTFKDMTEFKQFCHNTEHSGGRHSECLESMLYYLDETLTNDQFFYLCEAIQHYKKLEAKPHRVTDNN